MNKSASPPPAQADQACLTPPAAGGSSLASVLERFFVRHRDRLPYLHGGMFAVFVGIIAVPAFLDAPPADATPLTHFAPFAGYLLWGVWFPLVFLSVIFSGRSWCGLLCPMGAASEQINRFGLKRAIPRWLKWEGTPVVSFIIVTILGQTVGVRDHAEAALEVFGGTMLAALLIGFLYGDKKRAWCRHACPIGLLLGVFSRLGAVDFAPRNRRMGGEGYSEKGVCPTMIDLARKNESRHCITCFRCTNPSAKGGVHLALHAPGREIENIREHNANPAETWFLFIATGLAVGGFLWLVLPLFQDGRQELGEWALAHGWMFFLEPGPGWLMSVHPDRNEVFLWLDFTMIVGFMILCAVGLTAILAALTALSAWLAGKAGGNGTFAVRFTELGYQYAPVAMVSLLIGLAGMLFAPIAATPLGEEGAGALKAALFLAGLVWSLRLGFRILARQAIARPGRGLPMLPGLVGSLVVGALWWPALFGL